MILSDQDIKKALLDLEILLEAPDGADMQEYIGTSSVDLRLGHHFRIYRHSRHPVLDPLRMEDDMNLTEMIEVEPDDGFIIQPGEFVLGATYEKVTIGSSLVARVEGRSSLGRLGIIVHSTAGFIDSGFCGTITLEIANINRMPIVLYPGMSICQLAFQTLSSPVKSRYDTKSGAKYAHQIEPQESRVYRDRFFSHLRERNEAAD